MWKFGIGSGTLASFLVTTCEFQLNHCCIETCISLASSRLLVRSFLLGGLKVPFRKKAAVMVAFFILITLVIQWVLFGLNI